MKPGLRQLFRRIGVPTTVSYDTSHGSVRLLTGSSARRRSAFSAQRSASNVYSNYSNFRFIVRSRSYPSDHN